MSREEALYQSLGCCGATLIAFVGVCHEFVGHILFPWGPAFLGGPIGWHALGLFAIASGLALLGGTLRLFPFPVAPFALLASAIGIVFVAIPAVLHHQFHMMALAVFFSGAANAYCYRKAAQHRALASSI